LRITRKLLERRGARGRLDLCGERLTVGIDRGLKSGRNVDLLMKSRDIAPQSEQVVLELHFRAHDRRLARAREERAFFERLAFEPSVRAVALHRFATTEP